MNDWVTSTDHASYSALEKINEHFVDTSDYFIYTNNEAHKNEWERESKREIEGAEERNNINHHF